jgi:hypothetical protein
METEHGPGLFLVAGALAVTGTVGACCTPDTVLLHSVPVLLLGTGTLLSRRVRTVLSIVQASGSSGYSTCAGFPGSCRHHGSRDEDECENRTDQDSFIHGFFLLVVAGPGFFVQVSGRSCIQSQQPVINDFPDRQLHVAFSRLNGKKS